MANTDRARKLLVRTALVTSTTIATLVGAQNLAMLDAKQFLEAVTPPTENLLAESPSDTATPVTIVRAAPAVTILQAAPSLTILRQSGSVPVATPVTRSTSNVIQPPIPSQISAPEPVIVQQPAPQPQQSQQSAPQRSRSSR